MSMLSLHAMVVNLTSLFDVCLSHAGFFTAVCFMDP